MSLRRQVTEEFARCFGSRPTFVVRAPGRVNLIGEHTDYNDGFVLPMAIDRGIWMALRPRADRLVVVRSLTLDETIGFSLEEVATRGTGWGEYLRGISWALREASYELRAWEGVVASDLPVGAGLSSSAALEMAAARAFAAVSDLPWDPVAMAKIGQRAENEWVGVNCGIMDQIASATGQAGHALLIDCRSLQTDPAPLPAGTVVAVLDTGTRRGLADSEYNERRARCEAAARFFGVSALRDVGTAQLLAMADRLDDVTLRRARHVVTENERTLRAAEAMRRGDPGELGRLMNASHASLRDDFEVSCPELEAMVACAQRERSCYGARMTGAGFGGCAVALVQAEAANGFAASVAAGYEAATGRKPQVHLCAATDGAAAGTVGTPLVSGQGRPS